MRKNFLAKNAGSSQAREDLKSVRVLLLQSYTPQQELAATAQDRSALVAVGSRTRARLIRNTALAASGSSRGITDNKNAAAAAVGNGNNSTVVVVVFADRH